MADPSDICDVLYDVGSEAPVEALVDEVEVIYE